MYKYAIWNNTFGLTSTLNYNFNIKEDHHFSVLAGYEIYNKEYKRTYAQGTKFPIGGLTELNVAATPQEVGSVTDKERMLSYFGRLNYDYQNKYFAHSVFAPMVLHVLHRDIVMVHFGVSD